MDSMEKPFAQSCENNKEAILEILKKELPDAQHVLEIGSGTGQHAVHFARHLAHLSWQTSDMQANHDGIRLWLEEAQLANTLAPLELDVRNCDWSSLNYDAVFTANSLHIMAEQSAKNFLENVAKTLNQGGCFIAYGPFNYDGAYTSESNARFDQWLYQQNPVSAIRDFGMLDECARVGGLTFEQDYAMPANNRTLVWRRA